MERAILLMFLSVPALVAGPTEPPPDISYQRLQVVTPANPGQTYQSFSKSLEAYSIRTIMFMYPKDRLIIQYQFITVSGTGNIRYIAGGRESNSLTIRAENSGARVFNYMVNIYTVQVATTTETPTTTTTTESQTTAESLATTTESPATTTESLTTTTESLTTTTESLTTTTTEGDAPPEEDYDTDGSGTTPGIPTTTCDCTCG